MNYLKTVLNKNVTPQTQPIPGSAMVPNSAGGYAFAVNDWTRLARFLVLGAEGGSYYATEKALSLDNAEAVKRCIAADGLRVVKEIVAVSEAGRAPRNDPALFALAMCAAFGDGGTRRSALAALPSVARIGTHLFHFAEYVDGMRGWGRGLRQAVGNWYAKMSADKLAYQAVKYGQRDGWSHRDLLRLSHPKPETEQHFALYHWLTQGWESVGEMPHPDAALRLVWAAERAKTVQSAAEVAGLVREYRLPREAVPTEWLKEPEVWEALLEEMPMTALIRNLATLTRIGLVTAGSDAAAKVVAEITNAERLRKARVHPIAVLAALKTYAQGYGERGGNVWTPVQSVVNALDAAFYASFENITPTNKRWLLALDVSGSMTMGQIAGIPGLTPRVGSAAMALITAGTEARHQFMAFSTTFMPLAISPRQRLDDVLKLVDNLPFSGTDCALPMVWALKNKVKTDVFVVYTDSETWAGGIQPVQALRQYRDKMGIPAKLIVCGMVSNAFTIADPDDAGMLDVIGFSTATPALMSDFAVA